MPNYLVYMTGPIGGCTYAGATEWRDHFTELLAGYDVKCLSPMRGKDYLVGETSIDDVEYDTPASCPKGIYTRDRWDSMRCDIMVANLLGVRHLSVGTMIEWAWANGQGTPVIMVMKEDNIHNHILVEGGPGFRVETLEEAAELVKEMLALEKRKNPHSTARQWARQALRREYRRSSNL